MKVQPQGRRNSARTRILCKAASHGKTGIKVEQHFKHDDSSCASSVRSYFTGFYIKNSIVLSILRLRRADVTLVNINLQSGTTKLLGRAVAVGKIPYE